MSSIHSVVGIINTVARDYTASNRLFVLTKIDAQPGSYQVNGQRLAVNDDEELTTGEERETQVRRLQERSRHMIVTFRVSGRATV
jgi:hypothetical protein